MKAARQLAVAGLALLACRLPAAAAPAALSSQEIFHKWHLAVVTIQTPDGSGTGFFDDNHLLYTAYHVLEGADKATMTFADGKQGAVLGALVVDKARDYAILRTDLYAPGPKLGDYAALQPGEPITVIGSPLGLAQTVTEGVVSAKRNDGARRVLQISAGISPGSSGSPVFNRRGEVVGLVTDMEKGGQLLNFATASADLKGWQGVPLSVAFAAPGSAGSHPGLILCRADADANSNQQKLEKSDADGYVGLRAVNLAVEDVPVPLAGALTAEEIRAWASEALTKAGVHILTHEEAVQRVADVPDAPSDLDYLRWYDSFGASVTIHLSASPPTDGGVDYTYVIEVGRPAVIMPGWVKGLDIDWLPGAGHVAAGGDIKQSLADKLQKDLATISARIQRANPPAKESGGS